MMMTRVEPRLVKKISAPTASVLRVNVGLSTVNERHDGTDSRNKIVTGNQCDLIDIQTVKI